MQLIYDKHGNRIHHTTLRIIKEKYPNESFVDEYFKFSIVRNPYDRFISEWLWHQQKTKWAKSKTLAEFAKDLYKMPILFAIDHIRPQYEFVYDTNGVLLSNYIGRFERLQESWEYIVDMIYKYSNHRLPNVLIKRQDTNRDKYYMEYYTPEVKQFVLDKYRIDFETFGYDK